MRRLLPRRRIRPATRVLQYLASSKPQDGHAAARLRDAASPYVALGKRTQR